MTGAETPSGGVRPSSSTGGIRAADRTCGESCSVLKGPLAGRRCGLTVRVSGPAARWRGSSNGDETSPARDQAAVPSIAVSSRLVAPVFAPRPTSRCRTWSQPQRERTRKDKGTSEARALTTSGWRSCWPSARRQGRKRPLRVLIDLLQRDDAELPVAQPPEVRRPLGPCRESARFPAWTDAVVGTASVGSSPLYHPHAYSDLREDIEAIGRPCRL